MPFPESPHVVYRSNPLAEVVCQLRFPPVLRIAAELPADFQDLIRAEYPNYRKASSVPTNLPPQVAAVIQADAGMATERHEFLNDDGTWLVVLTSDFLALRSTDYACWDEFHPRLNQCMEALLKVYQPSSFSRIGLRYVDVIQRSAINLNGRPWSELLQPHIAGALAEPLVANDVQHAAGQLSIQLDDHSSVQIRHGIGFAEPSREQCFIIDSDFFLEQRTEPANALDTLNQFNRKAGHLFRWCISDELHKRLGPQSA